MPKVQTVEIKLATAKLDDQFVDRLRHMRDLRYEMTHLIPVVTATCPSKLNQPVTQEANAAFSGSDNMAAQKYGPPLVGCALQTSAKSISRCVVSIGIEIAYQPLRVLPAW